MTKILAQRHPRPRDSKVPSWASRPLRFLIVLKIQKFKIGVVPLRRG